MKLSTGLKVRVGKSQQPAVVVSNGFTVSMSGPQQVHVRNGFNSYPGNTPGYADVMLANGQMQRVSVKKIREYKDVNQ